MNKAAILLRKLVLVGWRKNYITNFYPGVNVIYGDSTTGKSSIVECINYLLGSSEFNYDTEIETSVRYVALELELNGKIFLIKRDIFDINKIVEVFPSAFDEHATVFPKKYAPKYGSNPGPDGFFSDFLLASIGLPIVKVRSAPTKDDSDMVRLSFRDLFKFCYLNQDDVGSKNLLSISYPVLHVKNKSTFRYIFNLLDENITLLEAELGLLKTKRTKLEQKYENVSDFLRQTDILAAVTLEDSLDESAQEEKLLARRLQELNSTLIGDSEAQGYLRQCITDGTLVLRLLTEDRNRIETSIERYSRLKNDYYQDISKLKAVLVAKNVIGEDPDAVFNCPICDTVLDAGLVKETFCIDESDKANHEINSLSRRIREIDKLLDEERNTYQDILSRIRSENSEQDRLRRLLDEEMSEVISPYLVERDGISAELATVREHKRQIEYWIKVRKQQNEMFGEIDTLTRTIDRITLQLADLRKKAPSIGEVLGVLGDLLNDYLAKVGIRGRSDVGIAEQSILPVLRNRDYRNVTSGGLRTILSIGFYLSLFNRAVREDINLPPFLMIDTVGKYLGKTKPSVYEQTDRLEDAREGVSDPLKYRNIYEYIIASCEQAEEMGVTAQVILVDNDVPPNVMEKFAGFVVAQFSSTGANGLPLGLIDDAPVAV